MKKLMCFLFVIAVAVYGCDEDTYEPSGASQPGTASSTASDGVTLISELESVVDRHKSDKEAILNIDWEGVLHVAAADIKGGGAGSAGGAAIGAIGGLKGVPVGAAIGSSVVATSESLKEADEQFGAIEESGSNSNESDGTTWPGETNNDWQDVNVPSHPDNEYDFVGERHNNAVAEIANNWDDVTTSGFIDPEQLYFSIHDYYVGFLGELEDPYAFKNLTLEMLEHRDQHPDISYQTRLNMLYEEGYISQDIKDVMLLYFDGYYNTSGIETFTDYTMDFESTVLADEELDEDDRHALEMALAVARYSVYYWDHINNQIND